MGNRGQFEDREREARLRAAHERARVEIEAMNAPPTPPADSVVGQVQADLAARYALGLRKYGVTLERTDLGEADWMQHAYEEALDLACYLKRAILERGAP